jgi:hypothetical protein
MNFCKEMNFLLMKLSKKEIKNFDAPAFSLPRHNSSTQPLAELPGELLRAPFVWLLRGGIFPPLHCPYDGIYAVFRRGPRSFTMRVGSRDKIVSVSCLKACTEVDPTPGSLRRSGQLPGKRSDSPAATKWVSFADPLVSSPSSPELP